MTIYIIRNRLNGMCYVGQTTGKLGHRWAHHKHNARKDSWLLIHRAIAESGPENFDIFTVDVTAQTLGRLNELESMYINLLNTHIPDGYNLTFGGGNGPRRYGWKHSESTKRRMSEVAKGRLFTTEHRLNLSLSHRGKRKPLSAATIEKIRKKKLERDAIARERKNL